jgi:hypothetical protein
MPHGQPPPPRQNACSFLPLEVEWALVSGYGDRTIGELVGAAAS